MLPIVKMLATISIATTIWLAPLSDTDGAELVSTVANVLISADSTYGGCMASFAVDPATVVPGCKPWWLTFSCTGDFTDPVRGYRMLDQVQLAWATRKRVRLHFDDLRKHNGYCFVYRLDLLP